MGDSWVSLRLDKQGKLERPSENEHLSYIVCTVKLKLYSGLQYKALFMSFFLSRVQLCKSNQSTVAYFWLLLCTAEALF